MENYELLRKRLESLGEADEILTRVMGDRLDFVNNAIRLAFESPTCHSEAYKGCREYLGRKNGK